MVLGALATGSRTPGASAGTGAVVQHLRGSWVLEQGPPGGLAPRLALDRPAAARRSQALAGATGWSGLVMCRGQGQRHPRVRGGDIGGSVGLCPGGSGVSCAGIPWAWWAGIGQREQCLSHVGMVEEVASRRSLRGHGSSCTRGCALQGMTSGGECPGQTPPHQLTR